MELIAAPPLTATTIVSPAILFERKALERVEAFAVKFTPFALCTNTWAEVRVGKSTAAIATARATDLKMKALKRVLSSRSADGHPQYTRHHPL
jgi:hypothetical protein